MLKPTVITFTVIRQSEDEIYNQRVDKVWTVVMQKGPY